MIARAYEGRMNDPLNLRKELEGITTIVHLAGTEARGRDRLLHHVDVDGTERLVEEARRADVQRIIFVSRLGADPASMHALLQAKGQLDIRTDLTVTFMGDKRVLSDVDALARNGYGEDAFGNNVVLPKTLSYLRR